MPTGVLTSHMRHDDVIIIQVMHMGRIIWYWGRVSPFGRRRRVAHVWRVGARGQPPLRPVLVHVGMSHVGILCRFHQWLRLFLLYMVVWLKHKFDNFHF
jgi:hypothetical protein